MARKLIWLATMITISAGLFAVGLAGGPDEDEDKNFGPSLKENCDFNKLSSDEQKKVKDCVKEEGGDTSISDKFQSNLKSCEIDSCKEATDKGLECWQDKRDPGEKEARMKAIKTFGKCLKNKD